MAIHPSLHRGRIVRVNIPDSVGRATHEHPAVVLTSADDIAAGHHIIVVGISTRLDLSLPEHRVMLPWDPRPGGHYLSGLTKLCAAVCNWFVPINESDILSYYGIVPSYAISDIERKAKALGLAAPSPPSTQPPPVDPPPAPE